MQEWERFDRQRREREQDGLGDMPTGIHIESMELDGSKRLPSQARSGEKVPLDAAADDPRGLVFHRATNVRPTPIESSTDAANRFIVQRSNFQFELRSFPGLVRLALLRGGLRSPEHPPQHRQRADLLP
ncbi:MAG: hypothetical protein U5L05_08885 [Rubrivivax sp.]|nr:hypothetical protein [Rubrivivax sp.]